MDHEEYQFRTAAIGGFSKQDVLDYIARANQEHQTRVERLEKELSQTGEERDKFRSRVEEAEGRNVELSAQVQKLTGELEELRTELESLRTAREEAEARRAEQESAAAALAEERDGLRRDLEKAQRAAAAYERIKDRTAGIELEAHCRAQAVEDAAQIQVDKAKQEVEQWAVKVQADYDQMRTDIAATISHASGELERVRRSMAQILTQFDQRDGDLKALLQRCEEAMGPRMPDPLPLKEK